MSIFINVVGQRMYISSSVDGFVAGSQNFVKFQFNLSEEWNGLSTFAQFRQGRNAYNCYLDEQNSVYLPSEIKEGLCTLMLYGSQDETIGTSNYIELKIAKCMLANNGVDSGSGGSAGEDNEQGSSGSVTVTGAVAYDTVQSLSASQRTTAKNNIGVYVSAEEPADAQDGDVWFDTDDIDNESFTGSNSDNNVMVENPRFELIETITTDDETITEITRTTTPDGEPYQFRKVIVDFETIADISATGNIKINAFSGGQNVSIAMAAQNTIKAKQRSSMAAEIDSGILSIWLNQWNQYAWVSNDYRGNSYWYLVDTDYIDKITLSREQGFKEMKIAIYGVRYSNGCTCNALGDIAALLDKINGEVV